ncbi:hypothetical protein ACJQWK_05383 [Exserohilum turcicum]
MGDCLNNVAWFYAGPDSAQRLGGIFVRQRLEQLEQLLQVVVPSLRLGDFSLLVLAAAVARRTFTAARTVTIALEEKKIIRPCFSAAVVVNKVTKANTLVLRALQAAQARETRDRLDCLGRGSVLGANAGRRGRRGRAAALSPTGTGIDCCDCMPQATDCDDD